MIFAAPAASLANMLMTAISLRHASSALFVTALAVTAASVGAGCSKDNASSGATAAPADSSSAGDSTLVPIKYAADGLPARGTTPISQQGVRGGTGSTVVSAASKKATEEDTNRAMRQHANVDKVDCKNLPDNAAECDGDKFYFCDDQKHWVVDCNEEAKFGGATSGSCYEGDNFIDCLGCGKATDGTDECCDFSRTVCCDKSGGCFTPTK